MKAALEKNLPHFNAFVAFPASFFVQMCFLPWKFHYPSHFPRFLYESLQHCSEFCVTFSNGRSWSRIFFVTLLSPCYWPEKVCLVENTPENFFVIIRISNLIDLRSKSFYTETEIPQIESTRRSNTLTKPFGIGDALISHR